VTFVGMIVMPRLLHIPQVSLFVLGFFVFNHSLAAIGISSHVLAKRHGLSPWLFAALLLIVGAILFWLLFYAPGRIMMTAIALRLGLGFVHFLYDRWVYKLSDPKVRAIVGPTLWLEKRTAPGSDHPRSRCFAFGTEMNPRSPSWSRAKKGPPTRASSTI
jgi:hypothetical protein